MTNEMNTLWQRLGAIISLVEGSPQGSLGRTAIVKLLYLLQEVRRMPLGYDFRLYTYGPFDSDVLNDLETAQSFQALHIKSVIYPSGYGYEVRSGSQASSVKECVAAWLTDHQADLAWALKNFTAQSASELEITATIVYVDRELSAQNTQYSLVDLAKRVREVKPRFQEQYVLKKCSAARDLELIRPAA
jgi:hypothetical protein